MRDTPVLSGKGATRLVTASLAGALVAGCVLRVIGAGYGLPAVYNPDEISILTRALSLAETHLNPRNFLYPSLYFYALFVWEGLWFLVGRLTGVFDSLRAFETAFFTDPSSLYLAGRALSMVCGVITVVATWRLGSRVFGARAGLAAAWLLAVAPLAVRDAHYVKHDVPVTLLIVLVHLVLARDLTAAPGHRRPVLTGVLTGLACSTHYYAIFVAAPVALVALMPACPGEPVAPRIGRLLRSAVAAALAFAVTSPFLVLSPSIARQDMVANRQIVMDRVTSQAGAFGSLGFYVDWLRGDALGQAAAVLALVGLLVLLRRGWRAALLLLVFPLLFLGFIGNTFPASRYLNPLLPFIAVLGGATIGWMAQRPRLGGAVMATIIAVVAVVESAHASLRTDLFFRQTDTRTQALEWMATHVPNGSSVLIQPYSVPLRQSREGLVEALTKTLGSPEKATIKFRRQLGLDPYPEPAYRTFYLGDGGMDPDKIYISPSAFTGATLAPLRERSVTYVVLKQYNVADSSVMPLLDALRREGRLVERFTPYAGNVEWRQFVATPPFLHNSDARVAPILVRPGPIIEIWTIQ